MEKVIDWFKRKHKVVTSITVIRHIKNAHHACGYGERVTGTAKIKDLNCESSESSENVCYGSESRAIGAIGDAGEKEVSFSYFTGCLTYDEEMDYESI